MVVWHTRIRKSTDLAQILYENSTYQDKLNDTLITLIAPSKLKLLAMREKGTCRLYHVML